jgi:molecular chaperone DnaK (HSP70)
MEKVYVGIDLGTTTTLIATAKDTGEIIVLNIFQNDREGREIESSYLKSVAYFPEEGNPLVGLQAEYRGQQDPTRFVRAVKRQMGRRILLPVVEREPYQVSALYLEKALYGIYGYRTSQFYQQSACGHITGSQGGMSKNGYPFSR